MIQPAALSIPPQRLVIMGVSGCGKSTLGSALAKQLGWPFEEGDKQHSAQNVSKMASGQALNDEDRADWLQKLAQQLLAARERDQGLVMSCSALKQSYRDILRSADAELAFVHLAGNFSLISQRLSERHGHYMPPSLLQSQFSDLQLPASDENALTVSVELSSQEQVNAVLKHLLRQEVTQA